MKSHKEDNSVMVKKFLRPVVIGAVIGALCCTVVLLLMAAVMAAQDIPKSAVTPLAVVAAVIGSFVGGIVSARIAKERGLLFGAASGCLLFLLVMAAGLIVLKDVRGMYLLVKLATMIGCGAVGGVLGVNLKRH